ncbi:inositol monophosphatase family protein [Curtobacterium flaccumfaciens]|uniref:inositol monophosphatase family protein n=1 Tax=Curtobacterium flaccumfaciens TaxID=2035 RepID=UPI000FFE981F|nr:inositol monophosphatase family protein [Curtobacterium flaccumfaciens]MCS0644722.1 histidinol phosphatase [Curtobacterium flaccumfaciens pv. flaccumfaciens]MCS6527586.1 histidinol phosphatase [Curtobacterium flaccumfaciens pv. flaccumfaciens]RXF85981.1 histidinol phosphatase [Curtobacterium flaccumfaciens pv. flaccumfaciens]
MDLSADLDFARSLADTADAISLERFRAADLHVTKKVDSTHVTDADQAVERALRERLAAERPDDAFLGEETTADTGAEAVSEGHRQWVVDPIDGTANYLRGVPVWATLIALAVDGRPVLGVVSAPALGKRWWAAEGSGAFSLDGPLRVSGVSELADVSLSYNSIQQWDDDDRLEPLVDLSRRVWRTRAYGDMWSYMMVAEGVLDVAGEPDLKPWDIAALVPIVEEAGGRFTSLDGDPGPWHGSALASNGLVHDAVVEVIRRDS